MSTLSQRADAIRARNKILESVPGSGFHDHDCDVHGKLAAPHMRHLPGGMTMGAQPLPRISEHVVAFMNCREIIFDGPDAQRVYDVCTAYREKHKHRRPLDLKGTELKMLEEIPLIRIDDKGELRLWRDLWNDFLWVFDEMGLGVSCAPYVPDGTTP